MTLPWITACIRKMWGQVMTAQDRDEQGQGEFVLLGMYCWEKNASCCQDGWLGKYLIYLQYSFILLDAAKILHTVFKYTEKLLVKVLLSHSLRPSHPFWAFICILKHFILQMSNTWCKRQLIFKHFVSLTLTQAWHALNCLLSCAQERLDNSRHVIFHICM